MAAPVELEQTVVIQRPLEEVFEYMSNAENDADWRTNVVEIKCRTEGEHGVGTEYRQIVKGPMGRELDADLRYTAFEANQRLAFDTISGSVRPSAVIEFTPVSDDSTQVQIKMTWVPEGGMKAAVPLMRRMLEKNLEEGYENLRRHMESR